MNPKKRRSRRNRPEKDIFQQLLSSDYWEGYYALRDGSLVKCTDNQDGNVDWTVYSLKTGAATSAGRYPFPEGGLFSEFNASLRRNVGTDIFMRISNQAENPDRHDEIDTILGAAPDTFSLLRIENLVRHLKNRGISVFGGEIGGQDLSEGDYGGFYLLGDGNILYCRDLSDWDDSEMDCIVDGVVSYMILDPSRFSTSAVSPKLFGYLSGDRFSELAELLSSKHGRVLSCLAHCGSELFSLLMKAAEGDSESAAIASHRLKINLCIKHEDPRHPEG